ncbi:hypothetical protein PVK06_001646 [Gossypium arboreum]|uniref:Uncharacterized protein n=1 Tax=Gossypium arboreum TaxID=29729 RepID=A0ABR0R1Q2_GOSAR|nr:hypothetical protein PVK06_001646 [Gossypium arboreum]
METPTNSINSQSEALVQTQSSIQNSVLPVATTVTHNKKPAKFLGQNLKTWQRKMLFYLTMLNLTKFFKDDPPTVKEGEELQLIIHGILAEGMIISGSFQVTAIIEKLPLAWNDLKNYLKCKRKEMPMEDLIVRLRIEEDNRGTSSTKQQMTILLGKIS